METRQKRTVYTILLSVCLFLGVVCASLLIALILIGRNFAASHQFSRQQVENITVEDDYELLNDVEISNEISAKINTTFDSLRRDSFIDWRSGWRLPNYVFPLHYNLTLRPNLVTKLFTGEINITIESVEPRDHFVLHGFNLNLTNVQMFSQEEEIQIANFHNDSLHQLWVIDLENTLQPGIYYLFIEFGGSMDKKIVGIYRSSYLDQNDNRRYIATSKLEPTYARQAFPCFDEPSFKANFTVQIEIPNTENYIALSNMNVKDIVKGKDSDVVKFNTSVPMSTYLACFIVCDFAYTNDTIKPSIGNPIPLKVYATPAQVNKTKFALDTAKKCIEYYVKYFGIEYPLPKLDMIAIPDFVSGAMEHWGLVTYRETALLYDEKKSNAANQERVATVVAHELAHMWFGNLVTLNWWNDLWLNEGFATYMQFKAIDKIMPNWGMKDQFLIDELHPVLDFDATLASHPIIVNVNTPDQITEIFDSISYNKGSAVIRMLETAMGEDKFQEGIKNYLNAHKYKNAETKDLWVELQKINPDFNVQEVMDTWTVQKGYPVVTVIKENNNIKLSQKRFLSDKNLYDKDEKSPLNYKWDIPITYYTDLNESVTLKWFNKNENSLILDNVENITWIKINVDQTGYYRVKYPYAIWEELVGNYSNFSVSDRTNLLEDSFSLAAAGDIDYKDALSLSEHLKQEQSYVPWVVAIRKLNQLNKLLKSDVESFEKFQQYVVSLIKPLYEKLQWKGKKSDSHQDKLLRSTVLSAACFYQYEECLEEAKTKLNNWLNNESPLDVDTKVLVYKYGMATAMKDEWEKVFEKYMKEIDASEKLKLLSGLAGVKNSNLLQILLKRAEDESVVRSQDYFTCLQYISSNEMGTELIWLYVRENWNKLVERFTLNDRYLGQLIPAITSSFITETKLSEMETFFNKHPNAGAGEISRKKALENVKNNIKWVKYNLESVKNWLKNTKIN